MKTGSEKRQSTLRRQVNALGMHDGELQESKLWAQLGKSLCAWLIWKHAEALIGHWEVLLVLLSFLIVPEVAKKAITMRFASATQNTVVTDTRDRTVRRTEVKGVDNPDDKRQGYSPHNSF